MKEHPSSISPAFHRPSTSMSSSRRRFLKMAAGTGVASWMMLGAAQRAIAGTEVVGGGPSSGKKKNTSTSTSTSTAPKEVYEYGYEVRLFCKKPPGCKSKDTSWSEANPTTPTAPNSGQFQVWANGPGFGPIENFAAIVVGGARYAVGSVTESAGNDHTDVDKDGKVIAEYDVKTVGKLIVYRGGNFEDYKGEVVWKSEDKPELKWVDSRSAAGTHWTLNASSGSIDGHIKKNGFIIGVFNLTAAGNRKETQYLKDENGKKYGGQAELEGSIKSDINAGLGWTKKGLKAGGDIDVQHELGGKASGNYEREFNVDVQKKDDGSLSFSYTPKDVGSVSSDSVHPWNIIVQTRIRRRKVGDTGNGEAKDAEGKGTDWTPAVEPQTPPPENSDGTTPPTPPPGIDTDKVPQSKPAE